MGFVDAGGGELGELADRVAETDRAAGECVRDIAADLRAPIRVQITGRAGVGRTTVATVLKDGAIPGAVIEEPGPLDVPDAPDPVLDGDVVVCVLVESVRAAERAAVAGLERALFVLNKADALGESREPADVWNAALTRAAECSSDGGLPALPLIGSLATARAVSEADLPVLRERPHDLGSVWDAHGVAAASAALAADPQLDAVALTAMLRVASGADAVVGAVAERVEYVRARRCESALRALRSLAACTAEVRVVLEEYLGGDAAVALAAAAARIHLTDWNAEAPAEPCTADDAVRCAHWWRAQLVGRPTARQRRAIVDVRRHYLRTWLRMGGRPDGRLLVDAREPG
ncbi:hypothetical protein [Rhodococcus tibetensis]|uniref:Uncharacterized protein n=1 Tax=Rhodococcus tibetensis TaxID=2965064 RepID=A0ABT1QFR2_9NOCA|nr:hypothetical protein [Rhodococcus sp. FXJ9.536]MCQ4121116.1 hypothetical protein [Rhodococcus sp. FXJ9.536]